MKGQLVTGLAPGGGYEVRIAEGSGHRADEAGVLAVGALDATGGP